jgi:hypothetical protein
MKACYSYKFIEKDLNIILKPYKSKAGQKLPRFCLIAVETNFISV